MSIDGLYADEPPYPSFVIGMITNVNVERHTVDVQPYRMVEPIMSVPLFRSPGDLSLPNKEDIAIIIFDDRCGPACIGVYPKFIKEGTEQRKDYKAAEGDVIHQNSVRGGRTVLTDKGTVRIFNRANQIYEMDEEAGATFEKSPTKKGRYGDVIGGVTERSGDIKRKSVIPNILSDVDSQESLLKDNGAIITSVLPGSGLYEKKIKITSPLGLLVSEETVGSVVLAENSGNIAGTYTPEYSQASAAPPLTKLRKQTHYYNALGALIYTEEVDVLGNTYLKIYGGVDVVSQTGDINITATLGEANVTSTSTTNIAASQINLNGSNDFVVLAQKLIDVLADHRHPDPVSGVTGTATLGPTLTVLNIKAPTVKAGNT